MDIGKAGIGTIGEGEGEGVGVGVGSKSRATLGDRVRGLPSSLVALAVALPVLAVCANLFAPGTAATWSHLLDTVLPEFVLHSLLLCAGVGTGVALLGTGAAWLVSVYDFRGRRVFEWALLLPLAMPAYVLAYLYTDLLQFVGPVQTALRDAFGWTRADYWFPDVRSLPGAVLLFSCVLYPYVYLLARTAFLERAAGPLEAARMLGEGPVRAFARVSLPLARPALAAGIAQALMETLADYGTVAYFGVQTFTTGIYRAWFSMGDRAAAAQLAATLTGFVLLLLAIERSARGRARYAGGAPRRAPRRVRLVGWRGLLAAAGCAVPLTVGFLLPVALLLRMAFADGDAQFGPRYLTLARNSLLLAAIAASLAALIAVALAYAARGAGDAPAAGAWAGLRRRLPLLANRIVGLGYAVPGSVIAVGVLIPVTRLDHALGELIESATGTKPGLLLTGGIAALIYAYLARFLSIALQTTEAGMSRITPSMDAAARSLGAGRGEMLRRVHLPLLRGSVLSAALLVFVDVMKELPATLVMRPFNFDTLATQVYVLASDERLAEASTAALAIVVVGLAPIALLARSIARRERADPA